MSEAAPSNRRHTVWWVLALLALVVVAAGAVIAFCYAQLGKRPDGSRVSLAMPGSAMSMVSRTLHVRASADLAGLAQLAEQPPCKR